MGYINIYMSIYNNRNENENEERGESYECSRKGCKLSRIASIKMGKVIVCVINAH